MVELAQMTCKHPFQPHLCCCHYTCAQRNETIGAYFKVTQIYHEEPGCVTAPIFNAFMCLGSLVHTDAFTWIYMYVNMKLVWLPGTLGSRFFDPYAKIIVWENIYFFLLTKFLFLTFFFFNWIIATPKVA